MLKVPTPFPQVGSYALMLDDVLPVEQQRAELVRIIERDPPDARQMYRDHQVAIAFPLRVGSTGHRRVAIGQLIDATELTGGEAAELQQLHRYLGTRKRPMKAKVERAEALQRRAVSAPIMRRELEKLARLQAKGQPSTGSMLRDVA